MRRVGLALLAAALACGGSSAPPARTPTPLDHDTTGIIAGDVRFEGAPPPSKDVSFGSFGECAQTHAGPVTAGDVLVHDGAVENAFVYLKDGLGDRVFAVPTAPVVVGQRGCLFTPRVVGVQTGQTLRFVNDDPLLHNVHATPASSSGWNVSLPRQGAERDTRVDEPEVMVPVRCDLHPWMQAWVGVLAHPYFAVTGADGRFRLSDVPPGGYTVTVWHERFGTRETTVTLAPGGTAAVSLTFAAK
jgi:plastocyanin